MDHGANSDLKNYNSQREALLKEAFDLKYGGMALSENDLKANDVFENIRKQVRQQLPDRYHSKSLEFRDLIESSELLKILGVMPKGSLQHIHVAFYLPSKWFVENSLSENIFLDDTGKIGVFQEAPAEPWKSVLKLRSEATNQQAFDKDLENCFHLTDDEMSKPDIWKPFQKKVGNRLAICYREGIWKKYIIDSCKYAISEGFNNLQLRTYLPTAYKPGFNFVPNHEEIELYRECVSEARKIDPNFTIGIIFTGLRFMESEKIQTFLATARELAKKHSDIIIGFDFVAEEKLRPAVDFADLFLEHAKQSELEGLHLPPILHGGETLDQNNLNLYDLCLYKSKRIGHGINLFKHPVLYKLVKEQNICIEVNPLSNQILQYVADLRIHPAIGYHNFGLKISISSDDPGLFQTTSAWDFFAACISFEFTLLDLKRVILNSIETSCMNKSDLELMQQDFEKKWEKFVQNIIATNK